MGNGYIFDNYSRQELRHAIKRADPIIFEDILQFLEDDPRTSGSGYDKELMWKYITRFELQPCHLERLEKIALKYLERPMSREHKYMYRTLSRVASPVFWQKVDEIRNADNSVLGLNAYCLFPYSKGILEGEKQRLILRTLILRTQWGRDRWYKAPPQFSLYDLINILENEANWRNGHLVKGIAESPYIASRFYDEDFTSIDWSQCIPEILIPNLERALFRCSLDGVIPDQPISYIAYAFEKIGDEAAVPILIRFLEQRVDYKFESATKSTITLAIFRAFKQIGTPEAMNTIKSRPNSWFLQP